VGPASHYIIRLSPNFSVTDGRYGKKMNKKSVDWKICGSFKILLVRLSLAKGQWARLFWLKPLRYHILDTKYFFFITLDSQVPNTSYYQVQHFCPLDPKHLI